MADFYLAELKRKIDEKYYEMEKLERENKELIRCAHSWIYTRDGLNTGILYFALNEFTEDDELMRQFKKFFLACVTYETFGYRAGTYWISTEVYNGFCYFMPECMRQLKQMRLHEYDAYCAKLKSLQAEIRALKNEL